MRENHLNIAMDGSVVVSPSVGVTGELLTVPCPRRGDALQGTLAEININLLCLQFTY